MPDSQEFIKQLLKFSTRDKGELVDFPEEEKRTPVQFPFSPLVQGNDIYNPVTSQGTPDISTLLARIGPTMSTPTPQPEVPVQPEPIQTKEQKISSAPVVQQDNKIKELLSKVKETNVPVEAPKPQVVSSDEDQSLRDAFKQQQDNLMASTISRGLANSLQMGTGIKPDEGMARLMEQATSAPVDQELTMRKAQSDKIRQTLDKLKLQTEQDQVSSMSPSAKARQQMFAATFPELAAKLGPEKLAQMTPDDLAEMQKYVGLHQAGENIKVNKQIAAQQRADSLISKTDKQTQQMIGHANDKIAAEMASSRSTLGKAASLEQQAEKIQKMADIPDKNKLTDTQIFEIATNLDSMLKGGASTVTGTGHLLPHNINKDVASIESYIKSKPVGAGQGAFVDLYMETIERERQLAKEQKERYAKKYLAPYNEYIKNSKDPAAKAAFDAMLSAHNISFSETSSSNISDKQVNNEDKAAIEWAKNHPQDPRAVKIMKLHGM